MKMIYISKNLLKMQFYWKFLQRICKVNDVVTGNLKKKIIFKYQTKYTFILSKSDGRIGYFKTNN